VSALVNRQVLVIGIASVGKFTPYFHTKFIALWFEQHYARHAFQIVKSIFIINLVRDTIVTNIFL
jgi:hypothetical protein